MIRPSTLPPDSMVVDGTNRVALVALLCRQYPRIYRIAVALTGSPGEAESVANAVVARALKLSAGGVTSLGGDRWFLHHTVLTSRDMVRLVGYATTEQSTFGPMHEAISQLPAQQREAFLLHHGESLNLRGLATAMDCSTTAAANHLAVAVERLRSTGDGLEAFTTRLPALIAGVAPPESRIREAVEQQVDRAARKRRWVISLRLIAGTVLVVGLASLVIFLWRELMI